MASLKDIRKRIQSVQNTRQITRAMKMVAAAKLRRSQEAILNSRSYAYKIYAMLFELSKQGISHPLLEVRAEKKVRLVIMSGDRGLCGGFNANIFKEAQKLLAQKEQEGVEVVLDCIGRKSFDQFKKKKTIDQYHEGILTKPTYQKISTIGQQIIQGYIEGHFDAVYMVYNEFKSAIQQTVVVEKLLPIPTELPTSVKLASGAVNATQSEALYEPDVATILNELLPRHFKVQLFRAVLESVASEHAARMSAMENATKNASEVIEDLTLDYNKARQANITKELLEIIGGVEAMK